MQILGIAGSLRAKSYNAGLLRAATEVAPAGVSVVHFDGLRDIPPFDEDVEATGDPRAVAELKRRIATNDALLICTPEYNHGVPGVLKNAIDWVSRPANGSVLRRKPIALMGASTGNFGTTRAQDAWRRILLFPGATVLPAPEVLVCNCVDKFDADGNLTDKETRTSVNALLVAFHDFFRKTTERLLALNAL